MCVYVHTPLFQKRTKLWFKKKIKLFLFFFLSFYFFSHTHTHTKMSCIITELRPIDLSLAEAKPALIAVSPTVSIQTALTKMSSNKITSLPVFSHNNTEVVSIVNLFDILLYLVGENQGSIEKEKLRLNDPVERVLGLDSDRESYRMHKIDRKDKLIEVKLCIHRNAYFFFLT